LTEIVAQRNIKGDPQKASECEREFMDAVSTILRPGYLLDE